MFSNDHYYDAGLKKGLKLVARKIDDGYDIIEAIKNRSPQTTFRTEARDLTNPQLNDGSIFIPSKTQLGAYDRARVDISTSIISNTLIPKLKQTTDLHQRQFLKMEISKAHGLTHELQNHDILLKNQNYSAISFADEGLLYGFFLDAGVKFLDENLHISNRYAILTLHLGEMSSFTSEEFRDEDVVLTRIGLFKTLLAQSLKGFKTFAIGGLNIKPKQSNKARNVNLGLENSYSSISWDIEYNIVMPQKEVRAFAVVWQKILKDHKIKKAIPFLEVVDFSTAAIFCKLFRPLCAHNTVKVPKQKQNLNNDTKANTLIRRDLHNWLNLFRVLRKLPLSFRLVMQNVRIVETPEAVELSFNDKPSRNDNIYFERVSIASVFRFKKPAKPRS